MQTGTGRTAQTGLGHISGALLPVRIVAVVIGADLVFPEPLSGIVKVDRRHDPVIVVRVEIEHVPEGFQRVDAADGVRFGARLIQRRQQHCRQNCDDHYSIDIKLMSIGKYATYI